MSDICSDISCFDTKCISGKRRNNYLLTEINCFRLVLNSLLAKKPNDLYITLTVHSMYHLRSMSYSMRAYMYEVLVFFVGGRGRAAPPYPQTGRSVRIPMDGSTMSTEWRELLSSNDPQGRLNKLTSFWDANYSNKIKKIGI